MDSAFHAKVETMCLALFTDKVKHQSPDGYSVTNPDPSSIAALAAALKAQSLTHALVSAAAALGVPTAGAASWTGVMSAFGGYETAAQATVAAAETRTPATFASALDELEKVKTTIRDDLRAIGFSNRSACDLVFASGGGH